MVEAENAVSLDFAESSGEIAAEHYAFLVGEDEFSTPPSAASGTWG